jgi:hypothetical protein
MKYLSILFLIALLIFSGCSKNISDAVNNTSDVVCIQDVKICSDGTVLVRDMNDDCKFPSCLNEKTYVSENSEQCMVLRFMCEEDQKPFFDEKGCGCEQIAIQGKLKAIDCVERTQACTREYMPVCGQVQVQCIKAPCPQVMQTFSNKCEACANSLTMSYIEGACANDDLNIID